MLLDEPSMGLAPLLMMSMFDALKEINQEGTTILLVEQNARLALQFARRGYVLENGHLVVENHNSNPEFEVDSPVDGATSWTVRNNLFTSAALGAKGTGELELILRTNS